MTRLNPRCKHGIEFPELACAVCRGEVTRENQTREYGGGPYGAMGYRGFFSSGGRGKATGYEVTDDICPRPMEHQRRAPTKEEMREAMEEPKYLPVHPDQEEEMETEQQLMCPKCKVNPSPGRRSDNNEPKICKACRSEMARQRTKGTPKPGEETREPEKSAPVMAAGLDVLNQLHERLDQRVAEVRKIHLAMLTIREACGVEYEIRMPSLVVE